MKATEVFSKIGTGNMTRESFYGIISGLVIYGLLATAFAAYLANSSGLIMSKYMVIGLCIIPFIGIFMSVSDNWFISFIGYNIILIPFGVLLGPVLKSYDPSVVQKVCYLTAGITFAMGLAGTIFPNVFSKMGTALFFSLCCLVFIRILGIFIPEINHLRVIDWIAAGIFSLYIGYDMYRASVVACTLDNAVDIAISLYLDVLNLFLELLKLSKSDDD